MIELKQYDGAEVSPKDDAQLYDGIIGESGIFKGCEIIHLGANQLQIAAGVGVVRGRFFVVTQETILATVSDGGTKKGRLIIKIDTANSAAPISFVTQMAAVLPELMQEDINDDGTVYELPIAEYDIDELAISNLNTVFSSVGSKLSSKGGFVYGNLHLKDGSIYIRDPNNHTKAVIAIDDENDTLQFRVYDEGQIGRYLECSYKDGLKWLGDPIHIWTEIIDTNINFGNEITIPSQAGKSEMLIQIRSGTGETPHVLGFGIVPLDNAGIPMPDNVHITGKHNGSVQNYEVGFVGVDFTSATTLMCTDETPGGSELFNGIRIFAR